MKEFFTNILGSQGHATVYKSPKKGQKSFRITQNLLTSLWNKANKIKNKGVLILTIPANKKENYVLKCYLVKEKI